MSEIVSRWDVSEDPLVASLKLLYSLNIVSANDLTKLCDVLGLDANQIISSKYLSVTTLIGKIEGFTPIVIVANTKQFEILIFSLRANKINYKIYDGSFHNDVTLITPAQFLNAIANLNIPFKKFTIVNFFSSSSFDSYLFAVTNYSYYYKIALSNYLPTNGDVPSSWLAHYLKMQSRYVSIPQELLQRFNNDTDWWKYPWIRSNSNNGVDIKKLKDVSIRYGIPLQLLKSISRSRDYAERMLKLNGYSEDVINKVIAELFPS
ncbi:virion structural protein [Acidianus tailed spindle virus]|uniref:virion structural protein n=1 Tax=Acidianus tailed spindle virus TaxID=1797140 RepID=UPI00076F3413|nr:virion structural protein [Acidianus tailed spindle virus]AME30030.1 hypothetical protein ATSV_B262 [Acidianus tailed spindle virus]